MIRMLLRTAWISVRRDRGALALLFILPIVFFSIFAFVFGQMGGGAGGAGSEGMAVLVVDRDQGLMSRHLLRALGRQRGIRLCWPAQEAGEDRQEASGFDEAPEDDPAQEATAVEQATRLVRQGNYTAAVVIPRGWGRLSAQVSRRRPVIRVVYDAANPVAPYLVAGSLQAAAINGLRDLVLDESRQGIDAVKLLLSPDEEKAVETAYARFRDTLYGGDSGGLRSGAASPGTKSAKDRAPSAQRGMNPADTMPALIPLETVPARAERKSDPMQPGGSMVSYYAAGIGVMFLLFSMAEAGGTLLDMEETGTLERLLSSRVNMGSILLSKWFFFTFLGILQVTLMFLWGSLVFGLDMWTVNHLVGFAAMTVTTAAAAAGFGILLATVSRSRGQLMGLSIIVNLVMSALGGSMIPRFIMPPLVKKTSLWTFNGWALDGYLKVFWHDDPGATPLATLQGILPEAGMLLVLLLVFLGAARLFAQRWEQS